MKKILFISIFALSAQLFAQEMVSVGNNPGLDLLRFLINIFFFVLLPIILYCISSYSLSLLNKHYNKKTTSKISWIPFVRYYDFIKHATHSPKKAFFITLFPWILSVIGLSGVIILGMQGIAVS